jgi:hypothetical protein
MFSFLATDHQVARCREPSRCINCLGHGHFTRHCKSPSALLPWISVHSRLSFAKSGIHSRLTFPPGSIHNRITFLELSYIASASLPTKESMDADDGYVVDIPRQRPSHG